MTKKFLQKNFKIG